MDKRTAKNGIIFLVKGLLGMCDTCMLLIHSLFAF